MCDVCHAGGNASWLPSHGLCPVGDLADSFAGHVEPLIVRLCGLSPGLAQMSGFAMVRLNRYVTENPAILKLCCYPIAGGANGNGQNRGRRDGECGHVHWSQQQSRCCRGPVDRKPRPCWLRWLLTRTGEFDVIAVSE